MSEPGSLERRYRRLLAWYPPAHRREHADEMTGVLLAAARPGQRRPGLADSASLLCGGLRVRARASLRDHSDPGWRDALAVASVTMPLAWLGLSLPGMFPQPGVQLPLGELLVSTAFRALVPVVFTVLLLFRLRRTTAVLALMAAAGFGIISGRLGLVSPGAAIPLFFCLAEAAALLASDGPRRGWQILTWRRRSLLLLGTAAAGAASAGRFFGLPASLAAAALVSMTVLALALLFAMARRVLALLAVPAYPHVLAVSAFFLPARAPWALAFLTLLYLPPLAVVALLALRVRRSTLRAARP